MHREQPLPLQNFYSTVRSTADRNSIRVGRASCTARTEPRASLTCRGRFLAVVLFVLTLLPLPRLVGILSQLCPNCGALEKFSSPPKSGRCAKATDLLSSCISQSQYKVGSPADPSSLHSGGLEGGAEECVLELCIWELLGETACAQAFALTQMYDDLRDPVLQLEIQV